MRVYEIQKMNYDNKTFMAQKPPKREFIDIFADNVRNPRDVQDCVAVPRGIFKAYIYLMAGSSLGLISSALPQKLSKTKMVLNILCGVFSAISAVYFAKPYAVKGLSPTVKAKNN